MDLPITCATADLTALLHPIERKGLRLASVVTEGDRSNLVVSGGAQAAAFLRALCAATPSATLGAPLGPGAEAPQIVRVAARADAAQAAISRRLGEGARVELWCSGCSSGAVRVPRGLLLPLRSLLAPSALPLVDGASSGFPLLRCFCRYV